MGDLEIYFKKIQAIVRDQIKQGTPERIAGEIESLRRRIGLRASARRDAERVVRAEIRKIGGEYVESKFQPIITTAANDLIKAESAISQGIIREVIDGMNKKSATKEIQQEIAKKFGIAERYLRTVADTAQIAANRSNKVLAAQAAGINKFKYSGPRGGRIRQFCARNIGKIYTAQEIAGLSNGQGLDVLTYCGGYNCRHWWEPVL